eukprot:scaffold28985_cov31-Tisochrysis_lutea.AAC.5
MFSSSSSCAAGWPVSFPIWRECLGAGRSTLSLVANLLVRSLARAGCPEGGGGLHFDLKRASRRCRALSPQG